MSIQGDSGVNLKPNCFKLATVKYVQCYDTEELKERIHLETTDGDTFDWCMGTYIGAYMDEFLEARKNILSGKISPGTEITLKCNSKGILAISL